MYDQNVLVGELYKRAYSGSSKSLNFGEFENEILLAFRIRAVEEKLLDLFSKSQVSGTVHTCIGQEMTGVALCKYLEAEDWVTSNHRCHGHFIAKTGDWRGLIDELLGLSSGVSRGIGSSQHLFRQNFISNGTQGSLLPVASGLGLSQKLRGSSNIAVSFIGEGTLGEGNVYEALNLSSLFDSRHLIVCENNYYSQTTPQAFGIAGSIELRARAFGWQYFEASTWDVRSLFDTCQSATRFVREKGRPAFLKIDTYRLRAHSKGDDDRDPVEVAQFESLDLLFRLKSDPSFKEMFAKISHEVETYTDERGGIHSYYDYDEYREDQLPRKVSGKVTTVNNNREQMVKALNSAYMERLLVDDAIFIGEDIADPYGGAFKVTKGFQEKRPDQVLSTSISEAGLSGMAIGFSLDDKFAIAEIMFGDFIVNAMDQIVNNASKFHHMYGKQFSCGVTFRTPMGGRRGYGPTHSQSLEKCLLGIDNTAVLAPTSLCDPRPLISAIKFIEAPKIIVENKTDYSNFLFQGLEGASVSKVGSNLGTIRIRPDKASIDAVVVAYGYIARFIADNYEEIFEESDCVFELLCPQLIHPVPIEHFERSLRRCSKALIIEEGGEGFGWADGVLSKIVQKFPRLKVATLASDPVPIPSNRSLEQKNLVSIEKIIKALQRLRRKDG